MGKNQTSNCSYPSKFSPEKFVTAAQYITEIICEKKALADNNGNLPIRFWELDKWSKYFRQQIPSAHKLLKRFSAQAIIRALRHWKANKIYSLRAPHLIKICQEEEAKYIIEQQKLYAKMAEQSIISSETEINLNCDLLGQPRPEFGNKSKISKLKELDSE